MRAVPGDVRVGGGDGAARRAALALAFVAVGAACAASPSAAGAQLTADRWQPEAHVTVIAARTTALHAGVGVNRVVGLYARLGVLAAAGGRRVDGNWRASGRVDAIVRFHVDPLQQSRWGAYAGGGAALNLDDGAAPRGRAVLVVGYEGPPTARRLVLGVEAALGGGARVGLTVRRARRGAR